MNVKEIFDSSTVKNETMTRPRSRSVCASPVRSVRVDDSSDDNSTSIRRRATIPNSTMVKSFNKSLPTSAKSRCETCPKTSISERKVEDIKIIWDSLPLSLVKLGEDIVRHRDVATLVAIEALQEACAAEKLIKCLSIYSKIKASKEDGDPLLIDKFFDLQDSLSHTRLILQSLTNISPIRTPDSDLNCTGSIKEVLNLAVERKKKATSRIKSAISFDLSPCPCSIKPVKNVTKTAKNTNTTPTVSCIVRKERVNCEIKDEPVDWVKGGSFGEAADVA